MPQSKRFSFGRWEDGGTLNNQPHILYTLYSGVVGGYIPLLNGSNRGGGLNSRPGPYLPPGYLKTPEAREENLRLAAEKRSCFTCPGEPGSKWGYQGANCLGGFFLGCKKQLFFFFGGKNYNITQGCNEEKKTQQPHFFGEKLRRFGDFFLFFGWSVVCLGAVL